MNTSIKGIRHLAKICALKGVEHAVISPGSRNAPLIAAFLNEPTILCTSIVDERCAAFFALGIAQQKQLPVVLICTSGSAVLNYAPAIAEAFYQKIPLIIITADRPHEWIDQGENQSIIQSDIYKNYIKKSVELPIETTIEKDKWYSDRLVNEAINYSLFPEPGPVHINVPLREPLYDLVEIESAPLPKIIEANKYTTKLIDDEIAVLKKQWQASSKKMIIVGSQTNNEELNGILNLISNDDSVIILSEQNSNIQIDTNKKISIIDACVEIITKNEFVQYQPDIIITLGGGIVSKKLKFYFRNVSVIHWHVSIAGEHWDTFQNLSSVIQQNAEDFLKDLYNQANLIESNFKSLWILLQDKLLKLHHQYLSELDFCDFKIFDFLLTHIPEHSNIHFGNSTPIRYANLFLQDQSKSYIINANRGVSGIDGVTSTASGAAYAHPSILTLCISGDIAFLYDSNALWNDQLPKNLKIIVINNGGGNIFKIIPGPTKINQYDKFIETKQTVHIQSLVTAFGLNYYFADSLETLQKTFIDFISSSNKASVLEIKTDSDYSANALKNYFQYLIKNYE